MVVSPSDQKYNEQCGDKLMREQSLLVSCPHCKTKYHIPPELLGQKTECPRCTKQFTMELADEKQEEQPKQTVLPPRMNVQEPPPSRPSGLVIVSCRSCGAKYEIPDEFLGDSAECSECGDIFPLTEDPDSVSDNTEVIAAKAEDHKETVYEIADLAYHVLVLMAQMGITPQDIRRELAGRHVIDHKVKQEKMT